jgi:hypothetical protein
MTDIRIKSDRKVIQASRQNQSLWHSTNTLRPCLHIIGRRTTGLLITQLHGRLTCEQQILDFSVAEFILRPFCI